MYFCGLDEPGSSALFSFCCVTHFSDTNPNQQLYNHPGFLFRNILLISMLNTSLLLVLSFINLNHDYAGITGYSLCC